MIVKLINGDYQALVDTKGAQILSFTNGIEELFYDGALNPDNPNNTWKRTAPRLNNPGPHEKTFFYKGQTYERSESRHGFLRNEEFKIEKQTEKYVLLIFEQLPNKEFPFAHKVCVELSLTDKPKMETNGRFRKREVPHLEERVWIVNTAKQHEVFASSLNQNNMIYAYGQHPAFQITNPERTFVFFTHLNKEKNCGVEERKRYFLDLEKLKQDKPETMKFLGIKSGTIHLCEQLNEKTFNEIANMDFIGPNILLWSNSINSDSTKQFICIEPWQTFPGAFDKNLPKLEQLEKGKKYLSGEIAKSVILLGKKNSCLISSNYSFGRGVLPFAKENPRRVNL